jgi:4-alpha-glucanotransferase
MLHGPFGIGVIGEEAMEFIDFLHEAGFRAWQVLPLENTGVSFSPYKCISAYAGEPMLIDPRALLEMGLITPKELSERASGTGEGDIDYELVQQKQSDLLRVAFSRLDSKPYSQYKPFWLDSYALYMAIRHSFDDTPWYEWPDEGLRNCDPDALKTAKAEMSGEIELYKFIQWLFHLQWSKLKEYANTRGISIIGDMSIYMAEDNAEVWCRRELFDTDEYGVFRAVGGVPPDYFNADGQLWGTPLYNWKLMKKEGYEWWVERLKTAIGSYDLVRLDHFRGFESYWRIPAKSDTAREGKWVKGPGRPLFKAMEAAIGNLPVIAEDLGEIDEKVEKLLDDTGFRGMRILQFSFGYDYELPHNYTLYDVAYTGTHDNTTLLAWMFELEPEMRDQVLDYIGFKGDWTRGGPNCAVNSALIQTLFMSGASLAIVPIQDLLGYGADTRTNTPGTKTGNWRFRIQSDALGKIDASFYRALIKRSRRENAPCLCAESAEAAP